MTIRGVSADEVRIGDQAWSTTVALTAKGVLDGWPDKPVDALTADDFGALLEPNIDIVVLGTGTSHLIPPRDLVFAFARRGVGLEAMTTRAAARTFNVLVGEGRQVAAVLYL
jgi:uncharacterized protein